MIKNRLKWAFKAGEIFSKNHFLWVIRGSTNSFSSASSRKNRNFLTKGRRRQLRCNLIHRCLIPFVLKEFFYIFSRFSKYPLPAFRILKACNIYYLFYSKSNPTYCILILFLFREFGLLKLKITLCICSREHWQLP